jgi:hypothetical protein
MNLARTVFGAAMSALLVLSACETAPPVSVLQAHDASVAPGSTYAWAPVSTQEMQQGDPRIDNDIIRSRIRMAVDTNLAAKGFRLVDDPASAQLLVAYYVGLQQGTDYRVDTYGGAGPVACGWRGCVGGYGWGMYGAPMDADVRAINYTNASLILDLKDRSTGKLAWRASSTKRVTEGDGAQDKLNALVANMVKSLPATAAAPAA